MLYEFNTSNFKIEYTESPIEQSILWESHCHAQYEMIAVADGDITVLLEGQNYRLKKNQILIIPPLCYHSVMTNEKGDYKRITALFGSDTIPSVMHFEFAKNAKSAEISATVIEELKELCKKDSFYAPLIQSFMVQIFYSSLTQKQSFVTVETDEFLHKSLKYIDEHLHEKILLDDLAKYTARSKSSFCHLFEKKMNISPKQYILQKKFALASKLIDGGVPHTVAAMQIGYENYSNFYRLYNKWSPKKQ